MRFLSTFFGLIIFVILLIGGGFLVTREVVLSWGVKSFKASLVQLERAARNNYSVQCAEERSGEGATVVSGLTAPTVQLRFISDTEYLIEAACDEFLSSTILISRGELGPYMTKIAGSSGVMYGPTTSMVELAVFEELNAEFKKLLKVETDYLQRTKVIGVENTQITTLPAQSELGVGPITSCSGYGYQCCKPEETVGVGEKISGVPGCEQTCYRSCAGRPIVLSFNTNPLFDIATRTLIAPTGSTVEFRYVGTATDPTELRAIIDFGDGQKSEQLAGEAGSVLHKYHCPTGNCKFTSRLKLLDSWGIESYQSTVSELTIQVQ